MHCSPVLGQGHKAPQCLGVPSSLPRHLPGLVKLGLAKELGSKAGRKLGTVDTQEGTGVGQS